jgi:hypothetical protein
MPRDDQHVVGEPPSVKVFQHGKRVRPDDRQKRIGRPVEQLDRRNVRLEIAMGHQRLDRIGITHEGARLILIPQAVGVADAVGAAKWTALDVIQGQAALAVLDHVTSALGQAGSQVFG